MLSSFFRRSTNPAARWLVSVVALVFAALLTGCGTLPPTVAPELSQVLAPDPQSPLVQVAIRSTPEGGQSGVRLMPLGIYSLEARIQLAERAKTSLDLQYYVIEDDATGRLLLRKLRDAALRGVRVRLLVDDLYTTHTDEMLRALAAYPNVQVRLFNPFCCARWAGLTTRFAASIFDFGRLNHRMHNKLFVADGVMAVIGGRNIADEYFLRNPLQNFIDIDAFVIGAAVTDMNAIFDRYWNSEVVRPIETVGVPLPDKAEARAIFESLVNTAPLAAPLDPPPVDVLGYGPIGEDLEAGQLGLSWGIAHVYADPPEKLLSEDAATAFQTSVTNDVVKRIWEAETDLVITSPYLIPGERGMKTIRGLAAKGIKATIVTNSLAATDEPLVHNGYARYRPQILAAGVDLYELSPTRTQHTPRLGVFGSSLGRLHAKTVVIDRKTVFIGSMNLDPRSASANTEFGMFIDNPAIAKELLRVVNISKLQSAYRVRLNPNGSGLQWISSDDDKEMVQNVEPESSRWLRLHNMFFGWFVPEELL